MFKFVWCAPPDEAGHYINKNVNWVGRGFYIFYIFILLVGSYTCHVLLVDRIISSDQAWTLVNVVHGIINFTVMHYVTGVPADLNNDEFYQLTWWEQLDDGVAWTSKKRNLIIISVILFLVVSQLTDYKMKYLLVNLSVLGLVLIPKLPQFYRVRFCPVIERTGKSKLDDVGSKCF